MNTIMKNITAKNVKELYDNYLEREINADRILLFILESVIRGDEDILYHLKVTDNEVRELQRRGFVVKRNIKGDQMATQISFK